MVAAVAAAKAYLTEAIRQAPGLGLTGTSEIILGPHGIVAERVAYDLNLACGQLRRC